MPSRARRAALEMVRAGLDTVSDGVLGVRAAESTGTSLTGLPRNCDRFVRAIGLPLAARVPDSIAARVPDSIAARWKLVTSCVAVLIV